MTTQQMPASASPLHYVLVDHENVQPTEIGLLDRPDVRVLVFIGATQGTLSSDMAMCMQKLGDRANYVRASAVGKNALDFHIAYYIGRLSMQHPGAHFHVIAKDKGYDPLLAHLKDKGITGSRVERIAALPCLTPQGGSAGVPAAPAAAKSGVATKTMVRFVVDPEPSKHAPAPAAAPKPTALQAKRAPAPDPPAVSGQSTASPLPLDESRATAQRWTKLRSGLKKMKGKRPSTMNALKKHVAAQFSGDKLAQDTLDALIAGLVKFGLLTVAVNNRLTWHDDRF